MCGIVLRIFVIGWGDSRFRAQHFTGHVLCLVSFSPCLEGVGEEEEQDGEQHDDLHEDDGPKCASRCHLAESVEIEVHEASQYGVSVYHGVLFFVVSFFICGVLFSRCLQLG